MKHVPSLLAATLMLSACGQAKKPVITAQPEGTPAVEAAPAAPEVATASETQPASVAQNDRPAGERRTGGRTDGPGGPGRGNGQAGGGNRGAEFLDRMKESLTLSDDQAQQLGAVFAEDRPAMEALRDDQSLTREQRREKMRALRDAMEPKIKAILTPEQQAKWEEQRAQMRANRGGGGPPGGDGR